MLVSDGVTTKLGQTPVVAKLDPSRAYDLVLAAQDRPTIIRHLPAHTTREVDIDFDAQPKTTRTSPAPSRIATVAKPHANVATHRRTSKHQKIATRRTRHHETARRPRRREVAAATRAKRHASARVDRETGTLALETDPPCEIVIDGKVTHLHTPQRAIRLSHGPHAVKLVNRAKRIQQSFVVHVEAGRSTKLFHRFRTH